MQIVRQGTRPVSKEEDPAVGDYEFWTWWVEFENGQRLSGEGISPRRDVAEWLLADYIDWHSAHGEILRPTSQQRLFSEPKTAANS